MRDLRLEIQNHGEITPRAPVGTAPGPSVPND